MTLPNVNGFDLAGQKAVTLQTAKFNRTQRTASNSSSADYYWNRSEPSASNRVDHGIWQRKEQHQQEEARQPQNLTDQRIQSLQQMQINEQFNQTLSSSHGEQKPSQQKGVSGAAQLRIRHPQNRSLAWAGYLEWMEKTKPHHSENCTQNRSRELTCQISVNTADGDLKRKVASWPSKLWIKSIPKILFQTDDNKILPYLKNAKRIEIEPSDCRALRSLLEITTDQYVGSIHFEVFPKDGIRMLILVYAPEKRIFDGLVPNDQEGFIDTLKRAIAEAKNRMTNPHNSMVENKVYPRKGRV